jgi:xanthine dehydrogenase large subunit
MNAPTPLHVLAPTLPVSMQQGQDIIHESATLHVTGEATYTDDIPELRGTLYAALITSPVAHGELLGDGIDREAIMREHGVVAVYTAKDIPGENNCGPIIHDDPFLADGKVEFLGQAVAVVVAREMLYAREAAHKAKVLVRELPAILTVEAAMAANSFVMPAKGIVRGDAAAAIASCASQGEGHHPHRPAGAVLPGRSDHLRRAA